MNIRRKLIKALSGILPTVLHDMRRRHPETYAEELDYQATIIIPLGAVICIFAFLPYIAYDRAIHPQIIALFWIRIGLSAMAILVLPLFFFARIKYRGLVSLALLGGYLEIATGLLTGLTGSDPVYLGGYFFVLMMIPLAPLPRWITWTLLVISVAVYAVTASFHGANFTTNRGRYSLNDLATLTVVAGLFVYLLDQIRYRSWKKSKLIEENKQRLQDDKEKIDSLLLNILPRSVADELKAEGYVEPNYYDSVTVVFTDFVEFTRIAESLTPQELVSELHHCFCYFDHLMDRHQLEKLKTIGDSYMYAGGIPEKSNSHPVDAVLAAIEMRTFMRQTRDEKLSRGKSFWYMRIGINTGPLMAGVVGEKKFVYDVWGDSVNMASRMESSGEINQINVSPTTNALITDFFETVPRGKIMAKGKGLVEMHFVRGIHSELSVHGAGLLPNEQFFRKYEEIFRRPIRQRYAGDI